MKALSEQKTKFDYPFPWDRITNLSLDLKRAMPLAWKERKSRFRKNRGKVLSVQMDGSGLSAKSEELLTMADIGAGGRESREDKWLGQGLRTHAHSCAPHTRGQRALLVTLMKESVDLYKSAPSIMWQPSFEGQAYGSHQLLLAFSASSYIFPHTSYFLAPPQQGRFSSRRTSTCHNGS